MSTGKRKNQRKLLIIACSSRKLRTKGLLPAIQRYDGVTYRVIRKAQREGYFPHNVDVKILSAKFGLIDAATPIPYYDRQMNVRRAGELAPKVSQYLKRLAHRAPYSEVFLNMGRVYFSAINGIDDTVGSRVKVQRAEGGIGSKAKAMKRWLLANQ